MADNLLRSAGAICYYGGTWTQAQLNRKIREQDSYLPDIEVKNCCDADDMVFSSMYTRLAKAANLNPLYTEVFRMHINGFSGNEISRALKIGRLRTFRIISRCKYKLQKVYQSDPYAGWYNVYLSEINRH
jgi:hypothetical protein